MVWLGIDLGTQSVRTVALAGDGTQLAVAGEPLHSERDGERHEQDPAQWCAAVRASLGTVASRLAPEQRAALGGIAVDGTSGTFTVLDPRGEPLSPGIMYDDNRAAGYVARVREAGAGLWDRLGYTAAPSWAVTELAALAETSPGLLGGGNRLAHQSDVITRMLTGHEVATDSSHAMKTGYDIVELRWPAALFEALGVPPAVLPEVVTPGTKLGSLCAVEAAATGLPQGIPVFAGMTDGCAAQLGSGALAPGDWNSVLGTTLVLKGTVTELRGDPTGTVYAHRGPEAGTWLPGGASGAGAGVLGSLFGDRALDELTEQALRTDPLPCYPLGGTGERFPFVAPDARGFIRTPDGRELPLQQSTVEELGAVTVCSSVLHSVAFTERLCFDTLTEAGFPVQGRIRIGGGAVRNERWNQLRADVLGRTLEATVNAEAGAGMAVLAAWASDDRPLPEVAAAMTTVRCTYEPGTGGHDEQYARFRALLRARGWLAR